MIIYNILLASLGYFVDIYDLILFSIVRVKSLQGLGVSGDQLLTQGVFLLNMQMGGMLVGGILWGMLGDKRGRLSVLIGSIFLYSIATFANGFVHSVGAYAVLRLIAGIGLAGELGAGITLVSEGMSKQTRFYGVLIVALVGVCGAVAAAFVGEKFDWRIAYFIGGGLGLGLLLLRIKAAESGMFNKLKQTEVKRGSFSLIFKSKANVWKYLRCILIGVPLWFIMGVLLTFAPEFAKALGMQEVPSAGRAILTAYMALTIGGLGTGILSLVFKSRKKVVAIFMVLNAACILMYLFNTSLSLGHFYFICFTLGMTGGHWAVIAIMAAEQFGTNIRATVATSVPNFVRGAVVPLTLSFQALKSHYGVIHGALIVAVVCVVIAFVALMFMEETHGKDLDYIEPL